MPSASDIVERGARALCAFNCEQICSGCPNWTHYAPATRAVIAAIRDTPLAAFEFADGYGGSDLSYREARAIYQRVLDAALAADDASSKSGPSSERPKGTPKPLPAPPEKAK